MVCLLVWLKHVGIDNFKKGTGQNFKKESPTTYSFPVLDAKWFESRLVSELFKIKLYYLTAGSSQSPLYKPTFQLHKVMNVIDLFYRLGFLLQHRNLHVLYIPKSNAYYIAPFAKGDLLRS